METLTIAKETLITGEALFAMGDIGRCELIEGRIVKMSPTGTEHGKLELRLGHILADFIDETNSGEVLSGETGIYIKQNPDTIRGADLLFISNERWKKRNTARAFLDVAPELVVEIVSPTDRWQDIREKIRDYFSIDVTWVWIVEPKKRAILVFTSPTAFREYNPGDTLKGEGALKGFELGVTEYFSCL